MNEHSSVGPFHLLVKASPIPVNLSCEREGESSLLLLEAINPKLDNQSKGKRKLKKNLIQTSCWHQLELETSLGTSLFKPTFLTLAFSIYKVEKQQNITRQLKAGASFPIEKKKMSCAESRNEKKIRGLRAHNLLAGIVGQSVCCSTA